ncbi:hypothetical protein IW16_20355 [Chryseobacterium vrystaatense]|uniref:Uncharacterized protein n=1 Tax=Chryseobacterium vrystaatense TaxID=307480 RepID=A0ABR4UK87_9FLAO|nr:hypothetical protein IW16_20355 [Chryseobacterium vrystaatense]
MTDLKITQAAFLNAEELLVRLLVKISPVFPFIQVSLSQCKLYFLIAKNTVLISLLILDTVSAHQIV